MMEMKLMNAAAALPFPKSDFEDCVAKVPKKTFPSRRFRPVFIALAIVIMLGSVTIVYAQYKVTKGLRSLLYSDAFIDAELRADKFDLVLPETFDGYTFRHLNTSVIVPRYMPLLQAAFYPGYRTVHVAYACEDDDYAMSVGFGDIEDDYWRTFFGYDLDGCWNGSEKYAVLESVEYKGFTIHTGIRNEDDFQSYTATWVDPEKGVCVDVTAFDGRDPLPLAMEIIDASQ